MGQTESIPAGDARHYSVKVEAIMESTSSCAGLMGSLGAQLNQCTHLVTSCASRMYDSSWPL